MEVALALLISGVTIDVPAGGDLAAALARARPGDAIRLGPGEHRGSLGTVAGVTISGAGASRTSVVAREGEDGLVVSGDAALAGLSIRAGPERSALKVERGVARLDDVALAAGSCGAYVDGGRLEGRGVDLSGGKYGLLVRSGEVALDGGSARGKLAGVGILGGAVSLRRLAIVGPAREAGLSVAGGSASLEGVVLRRPGPSGISVSGGGRLDGVEVTVAGATETQGFLGDCLQVNRATARLHGATLVGCAGAAVEASGGRLSLSGVDAAGGSAGCLVLVDGAAAELSGNLCAGRGPGLVLAGGAHATAQVNRWWTDPVFWVDCGSGARVELGRGETARAPCAATR
ncbi:MAG TPA: hypothetical protein VF841_14600 [Anaeromyxobacter sp.]